MKKIFAILQIALCICLVLSSCATTISNEAEETMGNTFNDDIKNMSRKELKAELGDNYYTYINFKRLKNEEIPYGEGGKYLSEDWTQEALEKELKTILENKDSYQYGSNEQAIAEGYRQYLDIKTRNSVGIKPLEKGIREIKSVKTLKDLMEVCAKIQWDYGCSSIFNLNVNADYFDSNKYGVINGQIQMPVSYKDLLENYGTAESLQIFIENVLKKYDAKDYEQRARKLTDMLVDIAERSIPQDELRNEIENSRKVPIDELPALYKNADISGYIAYLKKYGTKEITVVDCLQAEVVGEYLKEENVTMWKDYLMAQLLFTYAEFIPEKYAELFAALGISYEAPSEKKATEGVLRVFSKEMAYIFSKEYADKEVIEAAKKLTRDIINAYKQMIIHADMVDKESRKKFQKKLENMQINIDVPKEPYNGGYHWIPTKEGGDLLTNIMAKRVGEFRKSFKNVGKKFDNRKFDWNGMMPQTYGNACYMMEGNYVVIPYATLTAPYFDAKGNYYKNLGSLGMIIGHEISHGFDSMGMNFDENGNLREWLGKEFRTYFEEKKLHITELYHNYKLFGIYPMDGAQTLGENIADLAGIQCVLSMAKTKKDKKTVLENYAKSWFALIYDKQAYMSFYIDEHSLEEFRVNVVVSQMEEFYEVYEISEDDAMYTAPQKRERVWE